MGVWGEKTKESQLGQVCLNSRHSPGILLSLVHFFNLFHPFSFHLSLRTSDMIRLSSEYTTALKLGDVNHIPSQAFAHYQTGQNSQKPVCFTEPAQLSCQSPVWRYADICTRPQVHVASSLRSSLVCWLCLRKELVRDTGERSLAGTLLFIIAFRSRNIFSKLELLVTKKFSISLTFHQVAERFI